MMLMSIALLTAGRCMLKVATPSETLTDSEFMRTPSHPLSPAGTVNLYVNSLTSPLHGGSCPLSGVPARRGFLCGSEHDQRPNGPALQSGWRYRKLRAPVTCGSYVHASDATTPRPPAVRDLGRGNRRVGRTGPRRRRAPERDTAELHPACRHLRLHQTRSHDSHARRREAANGHYHSPRCARRAYFADPHAI